MTVLRGLGHEMRGELVDPQVDLTNKELAAPVGDMPVDIYRREVRLRGTPRDFARLMEVCKSVVRNAEIAGSFEHHVTTVLHAPQEDEL